MAKVSAIECDKCHELFKAEDAVEKLTRYKGEVVSGEYTEDLCAMCARKDVPDNKELKPWPRMKSADATDES
jgi:hypothetical protein